MEFIGKPADYGLKTRAAYTATDYHKPSDQVKADWDLSGAVDDLGIFLEMGYRLTQGDPFPDWTGASEFRAKRVAMMK